jgi:WD40 repeat protein
VKSFDPGDGKDIVSVAFLPDDALLISSFGGLRRLDLETGSFELLLAQPGGAFLGPDGRHVLLLDTGDSVHEPVGTASVYDLRERRGWPLSSHGDQVTLMAWDPSGKRVVTGSREGIVRVGPVTGEEPHLLIGHQAPIWGVRVDPTGRFVASTGDGTVRIWPMPEGQPLHTWSRDVLLDKLRSLTNVRIVPDASAATGYRTTFLPFQGWDREPPIW